MNFFGRGGGREEEDERITETETYSTNYDRGYGGGNQGYGQQSYGDPRRDEQRFTEETTSYYNSGNVPPPPQVPYPWRPHWDDRERRYIFINDQTGERTWEFPGAQRQGYGGGGQGYGGGGGYGGGQERTYQSEQVYQQQQQQQPEKKHGHGMMYGALGAAAGLAGGAFLAHEAGNIHQDYEEDKYRVEDDAYRAKEDVEDFPEEAANWTGRKVGEVEDIPQVRAPYSSYARLSYI